MFIIVVLLAAILFGLARGGNLANLGALSMRWRGVIIAGFLIQVLVFSAFWQERDELHALSTLTYLGSLVLLLVALVANRHLPGLPIIILGFALNLLVIAANGGYMPSSGQARAIAHRIPLEPGQVVNLSIGMGPDTPLPFLADIFAIPEPSILRNVFSVGDVLIAIGAFYLIQRALRSPAKNPDS